MEYLSPVLSENILNAFTKCDETGGERLDLSNCNISIFPQEVIEKYKNTLTFLNMANNPLDNLPDNFHELVNLQILFFYKNNFTIVPPVLSKMKQMYMISFKSNQLKVIPENSLNEKVSWLILTDNQLEKLQKSIKKFDFLP